MLPVKEHEALVPPLKHWLRTTRDAACLAALELAKGSRVEAAKLLKIGLRTLHVHLADMRSRGVTVPEQKPGPKR